MPSMLLTLGLACCAGAIALGVLLVAARPDRSVPMDAGADQRAARPGF